MANEYIHDIGQDFKHLPEIYQIEACSACNLKCPMCLRTTDVVRPDQLLKLDLLEKMHSRGDFKGSYYVELQMSGEPTLHPQLGELIAYLKNNVGVMVGLSTHGLQIRKKPQLAHILLSLDALTISVDSTNPELYHKMRFPGKLEHLWESLDYLFKVIPERLGHYETIPFIELQLVKTDMFEGSGDVAALQNIMDEKGWSKYAVVRTTGDCFSEMQGRKHPGERRRNTSLCINPWTSVSVAANGDVVSCCFIFEPRQDTVNWYGNLYQTSLAEIWSSDRVEQMRLLHARHAAIDQGLKDQCTKCYLKSPTLIHQNIVSRLVQLRSKV